MNRFLLERREDSGMEQKGPFSPEASAVLYVLYVPTEATLDLGVPEEPLTSLRTDKRSALPCPLLTDLQPAYQPNNAHNSASDVILPACTNAVTLGIYIFPSA